jgi:hypothetical protein
MNENERERESKANEKTYVLYVATAHYQQRSTPATMSYQTSTKQRMKADYQSFEKNQK